MRKFSILGINIDSLKPKSEEKTNELEAYAVNHLKICSEWFIRKLEEYTVETHCSAQKLLIIFCQLSRCVSK
jgi:hypothetical protein